MGKNELFELMRKGTDALSLTLSDLQWSQLERFYDELILFNDVYHLVNAKGEELIIKHFLDSLAPFSVLKDIVDAGEDAVPCADVGSGGGFPAIPLAILFENTRWDLIERSGKRCGFLLNVIAACNLQDRVRVLNKDLKHVDERYRMVTFRAVSSLADVMDPLDRITADDGCICAYKGKLSQVNEELKELHAAAASETEGNLGAYQYRLHEVVIPFLDSQRTLAVMNKKGEEEKA